MMHVYFCGSLYSCLTFYLSHISRITVKMRMRLKQTIFKKEMMNLTDVADDSKISNQSTDNAKRWFVFSNGM